MPDRPNVLFFCTDQQQAQALGAVDDSFSTPNLDRLIERGTLFTGCHTTHPQCSPARSSMVTGLYPHQTGVQTLSNWGEDNALDGDAPSVGRCFREAGYDAMWVGRWDLGSDNTWELGWNTRNLDVTGTGTHPDSQHRDEQTTAETVDFVRDREPDADPFFLTASFNFPHPDYVDVPEFADRYDRDAIPLPASFTEDFADKPAFHEDVARDRGTDGFLTEDEIRTVRYRYRTMVSAIDDHVGRVLDALRANDLREETVVCFTSDHGDMQGAHRLTSKGTFAYDEILRIPMILDVPGRESRRDRVPDLCSLASLPSTLLDAAGLSTDGVGGTSLLPLLDRTEAPAEEAIFFEHNTASHGTYPYRGVRTREWKFVEYFTIDTNELYHMSADPHELENLAGDPEHRDIEDQLGETVREWWHDTQGDTESWTS